MNFSEALEAVKQGKLVAREHWYIHTFVFQRPSDKLSINTIQQIKSLPQKVKDYIYNNPTGRGGIPISIEEAEPIEFKEYLCMKAAYNVIINGWIPSQADIFAEDWTIIE